MYSGSETLVFIWENEEEEVEEEEEGKEER